MRSTVRLALFASLAAALGFLLAPLPNIELFTFACFCGGYALGPRAGTAAALLAAALYYGLNPYGSSLMFPPLFAAQLAGAAIIALLGSLYGALFPRRRAPAGLRRVAIMPFAALAALALPLLPSLALALVGGGSWQGWAALGLLMTAWGFVFNLVVFATCFEPLARQLRRLDAQGAGAC